MTRKRKRRDLAGVVDVVLVAEGRQAAGKTRRQPGKRRAGTERGEGRMMGERKRREGKQQQQGWELGPGGSDLGGAEQGGWSWEAGLERKNFAREEGQRGR